MLCVNSAGSAELELFIDTAGKCTANGSTVKECGIQVTGCSETVDLCS
jgi:hypothetical protein